MAIETIGQRIAAQELPTNPFVDVAMMLFLEDIAEKQGVEGLLSYMLVQGTSLAEAMPAEDYPTWDDFIAAINEGRSIFSALEGMEHFAGYVLVTPVSPFHEAMATYISLMGELLPAHQEVVAFYNGRVQNSAAESMNVLHQAFRKELVQRISVAGQSIKYAELSVKGYDGNIVFAPEGWLEVLLEKAQVSLTQLQMAIRQNSAVILVYPPGEAAPRGAEAAVLAPKALGMAEEAPLEMGPEAPAEPAGG